MILLTYRLNQKRENMQEKMVFMNALWQNVLWRDEYWHYFYDSEGVTLRFQSKYEEKVCHWLKKEARLNGFSYLKRRLYNPLKHEYLGVKFLGDNILPLFHELSVLCCKYPRYIILRPIHERLNHGLINMTGIHDFRVEANIYMDLAFRRAALADWRFTWPDWIYRFYIKIIGLWKK